MCLYRGYIWGCCKGHIRRAIYAAHIQGAYIGAVYRLYRGWCGAVAQMQMRGADTAGDKPVWTLCSHIYRPGQQAYGIQPHTQEPEGSSLLCMQRLAQGQGSDDAPVRWDGHIRLLHTAQDNDRGHGASCGRAGRGLDAEARHQEPPAIEQWQPWNRQRPVREGRSDEEGNAAAAAGADGIPLEGCRGYRKSFGRPGLVAPPLLRGENSPRKFQNMPAR